MRKILLMENSNWTYDEFLCFLLIYVSHVDIDYSDDEKDRLKRMFSEELYDKVYKVFDDMSDYQSLQKVLSYKEEFYPTPEKKKEVMDNIKIQFFVDGEYSVMEKEVFHFLEKML